MRLPRRSVIVSQPLNENFIPEPLTKWSSIRHGVSIMLQQQIICPVTKSRSVSPLFLESAGCMSCASCITALMKMSTYLTETYFPDMVAILTPWMSRPSIEPPGTSVSSSAPGLHALSVSRSQRASVSKQHPEYAVIQSKLFSTIFDYNDILYITIYTPWSKFFWCNITIYWLFTISLSFPYQNRYNEWRFCMGGALLSP